MAQGLKEEKDEERFLLEEGDRESFVFNWLASPVDKNGVDDDLSIRVEDILDDLQGGAQGPRMKIRLRS